MLHYLMASKRKINSARSLRQRETDLEHRIWKALRNRRALKLKFRRQHPVGPFVVDFACIEARLVVEIDGYWHTTRERKDAQREAFIRSEGFDIVRYDIETEPSDVDSLVDAIAHEARLRIDR